MTRFYATRGSVSIFLKKVQNIVSDEKQYIWILISTYILILNIKGTIDIKNIIVDWLSIIALKYGIIFFHLGLGSSINIRVQFEECQIRVRFRVDENVLIGLGLGLNLNRILGFDSRSKAGLYTSSVFTCSTFIKLYFLI